MPKGRSGSSRPRDVNTNISAVAKRAGVSKATVSRYLNGHNIRSPARERLMEVIAKLQYAPSRSAQSLKSKRTMAVALVIPDVSNSFYPQVVMGAERVLRAAGFHLILTHTSEDVAQEAQRLEELHRLRVDGYLVVPAPRVAAKVPSHLADLPAPVVFVDRDPGIEGDLVSSDNVGAGVEATRHLLSLGHRHIALLTSIANPSVHADRELGYRRAMEAERVKIHSDLIEKVPPTVADGIAATNRLLEGDKAPTAIFATGTRLAMGAVAALMRGRRRCPEDVSVMGFDDQEWQDIFTPRLTVVSQAAHLMGERAAERLLYRIGEGPRAAPATRLLLPTTLVVRDSCAPVSRRLRR